MVYSNSGWSLWFTVTVDGVCAWRLTVDGTCGCLCSGYNGGKEGDWCHGGMAIIMKTGATVGGGKTISWADDVCDRSRHRRLRLLKTSLPVSSWGWKRWGSHRWTITWRNHTPTSPSVMLLPAISKWCCTMIKTTAFGSQHTERGSLESVSSSFVIRCLWL